MARANTKDSKMKIKNETARTATSEESDMAMDNGVSAEFWFNGATRGGWIFDGHFYCCCSPNRRWKIDVDGGTK